MSSPHCHKIVSLLLGLVIVDAVCAADHPEIARAFLQVPNHYVGNITKSDRARWLKLLDVQNEAKEVIDGKNLTFSYDGEFPLSGEGPFIIHLFSSSPRAQVIGIFIERPGKTPRRSLYILSHSGSTWSDITSQVIPRPVQTDLCYEFSSADDNVRVCTCDDSAKMLLTPGRVLDRWTWSRNKFIRVDQTSNKSLEPTAPPRNAFSVIATTPSISSRCPASLVRFALSRSRAPAVMLFNASRGLSLSR